MRPGLASACLLLPLWLMGCAAPPRAEPQLDAELERVADRLLATAATSEDARDVLRSALHAQPGQQSVTIAGHWFQLSHATLDPLGQGEKPLEPRMLLVAQTVELAERECIPFATMPHGTWKVQDGGDGLRTLSAFARGSQYVSVGIELQGSCLKALSVEQAGAGLRR